MALRFFSLALGVCCAATDAQISADFDKACQAGQQDCIDSSDEMYLIQKKIEVGVSALETVERANKTQDPTVTTKGGGKKKGGGDKDGPSCPLGYEAKAGEIKKEKAFVEAPKSMAKDMDGCASDCDNHTDCASFEWSKKEKKCYMNTISEPTTAWPDDSKMFFCAKVDNCSFAWPWQYYNKSDNIERNVWNAWNTAHRCFWGEWFVWCLISGGIWAILCILVWKLFFGPEPDVFADPDDPVKTFEEGHFDCMRRPKICLCAFCCPAVQWADTMHLAGLIPVGMALSLYIFLGFLNGLATGVGWFPTGIFTCLLIVWNRQKLRKKLGRHSDTAPSWFFDFMYVFCCPCCAVAQEAMAVRYCYQRSAKMDPPPTQTVTRIIREEPVYIKEGEQIATTQPVLRGQVLSSQQSMPPTTQPNLRSGGYPTYS